MATYTRADAKKRLQDSGVLGNIDSHGYYDDDYLSEIEKYKNESWYEQLLSNPWLAGNQSQFSPNLIQQISSIFGDTSGQDKYNAELRSNRSQWLSEFVEKMRQQKYNSPSEQVARDIQAGLNPDLAGNIDSGSAAENDQPLLGHPSFQNETGIGQVASFFMNIYSLASGFAKDMMSFQSMQNQLTSEDLSINESIIKSTTDFIRGHVGQPRFNKDTKTYEFPELILDDLKNYANKNFRSRSGRRRFINEVSSSYNSARSLYTKYGAIRDLESAKSAISDAIGRNSSFGYDYSSPHNLDPMISVSKELNKLAVDIDRFQKKYTSEYFHTVDGKTAGNASNSQNQGIIQEQESRSYQRGMDKIINSTMSKIVQDLERDSQDPGLSGLISKGMLMYLSAFRLQMLPSLPSINLQGLITNKNYSTSNITM